MKWPVKVLAALVVAYAFSPIDLIPDFVPVLGYLDDLILVPLGLAVVLKLIPEGVMNDCREKAREADAKPTNYFAAAVIVLLWVGAAFWAGALVWRNYASDKSATRFTEPSAHQWPTNRKRRLSWCR